MSLYFWPSGDTTARAACLTNWGSGGLLIPDWHDTNVWTWTGTSLVSAAISLSTAIGYSSVTTDNVSGAWFPQKVGSLVNYSSGGVTTIYSLPSGSINTGVCFSPSYSQIYVNTVSGTVYTTASGNTTQAITGTFGTNRTYGLVASGSTLFTLLPTVSGLGVLSLSSASSGVSGVVALPFPVPTCLAATASSVAVGGWSNTVIASGFNGIFFDPFSTFLVGLVANTLPVYQSTTFGVWSFYTSISGSAAPAYGDWSPNGLVFVTTDPTHNNVSFYNYNAGIITSGSTFTLSNPHGAAFINSSLLAVCQPASNQVTIYLNGVSGWVSAQTIPLTGATCAVRTSTTNTAGVGYSSGVALLTANLSNVVSITATGALSFTPQSITADVSASLYASATVGTSGYLAALQGASGLATLTWTGSGSTVAWYQGQIIVSDASVPGLRVFGYTGSLYQQISVINSTSVPAGLTGFVVSPTTQLSYGGIGFAYGTSQVFEYLFVSPYGLVNIPSGQVSIYSSNTWSTASLGVPHTPSAITFDVSGNIAATTIQNDLYSISPTGAILSQTTIPVYVGQVSGTILGMSGLATIGGKLFASSSLAGFLAELI